VSRGELGLNAIMCFIWTALKSGTLCLETVLTVGVRWIYDGDTFIIPTSSDMF
jgi:hypothetical protein